MHIYEGVLLVSERGREVLLAGATLAVLGTGIGLRRLEPERLPRAAVLSAAFFVVSLVHVPLWPSSVHLLLTGLMGVMLGWSAFPAVLVALLLQAMLFSYGGLTALGLNAFIMAAPAVACHYLFRRAAASENERLALGGGFAAGATAILLSGLLMAGSLMLGGRTEFDSLGKILAILQIPLAVIEGLVAASAVALIRKVRPELIAAPILAAIPRERENG
ncbi:MAG: cobalt transporter CbiM [Pirellulales bacterium]|nr:cobalt transporter CbiM [Pirellulales bacterium]